MNSLRTRFDLEPGAGSLRVWRAERPSVGSAGIAPLRRPAARGAASLGTAPAATPAPTTAPPAPFTGGPALRRSGRRRGAFGAGLRSLRLRTRLLGLRPALRRRGRPRPVALGPVLRGTFLCRAILLRTFRTGTVAARLLPAGTPPPGTLPLRPVAARTIAGGTRASLLRGTRRTGRLRRAVGRSLRSDARLARGGTLGPAAPAAAAASLLAAPIALRRRAPLLLGLGSRGGLGSLRRAPAGAPLLPL